MAMKRFYANRHIARMMLASASIALSLQAALAAAPLTPKGGIPLTVHPTPQSGIQQFQTRANRHNGCNISAPNMNFGTYDIFSATPLTSTMMFTVTCGSGYGGGYLYITFGTGSSGTYTNRTMSNGTDMLDYNIYADAAHTTVVGDGTNNTTYYYTYSGGGSFSANATVYGLLPAQQNVSPGTYTDVVTITLYF